MMAVKTRRKPSHIESKLQQSLVATFRSLIRTDLAIIFAIPNGGARSKIEAGIMKAEGVTSGVADLVVLVRGGRAVMIEVKTPTGAQSDAQIDFQRTVEALGFSYYVVRDGLEFLAVLETIGLIVKGPTGSYRCSSTFSPGTPPSGSTPAS